MHVRQTIFTLLASSWMLIASACSEQSPVMDPSQTRPNILLIIADDLGKDAINNFSEGVIKPATPHIDAIAAAGLTFSNVWVNPTCSPTRAAIITGKYGFRTGVVGVGDVLPTSEVTLQQYISSATNRAYATAVIGKWHLAGVNAGFDPETMGIDHYAGVLRGAVDDYYRWQLTEDGVSRLQTDYNTSVLTDLSISWINAQTTPWFLWLAYNAPHTPFHVPPADLHTQGDLPEYTEGLDPTPYYLAAIEAMDHEIGRLLNSMPPDVRENTVIIVMGDNGTPAPVAQSPFTMSTAKGSLYQGGINVPMFISGRGLTRSGVDHSLITATDLFATIAEIAGVPGAAYYDSQSFASLLTSATPASRAYAYSELHEGAVTGWTIRDQGYKLIVTTNGDEQLFDLITDPFERIDLMKASLSAEQLAAKQQLQAELNAIRQ